MRNSSGTQKIPKNNFQHMRKSPNPIPKRTPGSDLIDQFNVDYSQSEDRPLTRPVLTRSGRSDRRDDQKKDNDNSGWYMSRKVSLFLYQKSEDGSRRRSAKTEKMEPNLL